MKLRIIYTFFALSLGAFIFFGNADGRAASQGQGNTGAPGDEILGTGVLRTCQTCHNNGGFAVTPEFTITDPSGAAVAGTYVPGTTYSVKMAVNATPAAAAYGFQAVALAGAEDVDGPSINTWTAVSSNAQAAVAQNGRQYAEQANASTANEFDMEWVAPVAGTGDVTFYYCGNAVNLMSGTNGDNAICGKITLNEDGSSSINAPDAKVALDIFPNPVGDVMHLRTTTEQSGIYSAVIFDQTGRAVLTRDMDIPTGERVNFLEVSNLSAGYYNFVLTDENGDAVSKKIIKQ